MNLLEVLYTWSLLQGQFVSPANQTADKLCSRLVCMFGFCPWQHINTLPEQHSCWKVTHSHPSVRTPHKETSLLTKATQRTSKQMNNWWCCCVTGKSDSEVWSNEYFGNGLSSSNVQKGVLSVEIQAKVKKAVENSKTIKWLMIWVLLKQ